MSTSFDTDLSAAAVDRPGLSKFLLCSSVVVFGIGQSLLFVLFGPLARDMGLTEIQFGLIFSLSNLFLLIAGPYWGRRSDKIGRKPVLLVGLVGTFVGTLLLAVVIQIGLWKMVSIPVLLFLLFAARSVYSSTATSIYPASGAYMADITSRQNRAKGMALIGASNSMGAILGPTIGAGLAFVSVLFPMYVASAIALIGAITIYLVLPEPKRHKEETPSAMLKPTDPRIRPFLIVWAIFFFVFTTLQFITAFYFQDRLELATSQEVAQIAGLAMGTLAVVNVFVQVVILQLFQFHPRTLLRICLPMFTIALLIIGLATTLIGLLLGYAFLGLGFSVANPGINGSASLSVEPHEQGTASGLLAAATTVGVVFGPILGTSLYQIQINLPMYAGAALAALTSIFVFRIKVPDPKPYVASTKTEATAEKS